MDGGTGGRCSHPAQPHAAHVDGPSDTHQALRTLHGVAEYLKKENPGFCPALPLITHEGALGPTGQRPQLLNEPAPGDSAGPLPEAEKAQGTAKASLALSSVAEGQPVWEDFCFICKGCEILLFCCIHGPCLFENKNKTLALRNGHADMPGLTLWWRVPPSLASAAAAKQFLPSGPPTRNGGEGGLETPILSPPGCQGQKVMSWAGVPALSLPAV